MQKYRDLVRKTAKEFFEEHRKEYVEDDEKFGGGSAGANFLKWVDRTQKLNAVVEGIVAKWRLKEFQWVQTSTRNPAPQGGDPRSNAFGSFYSDVIHELKRLNKKAPAPPGGAS